MAYSKNDPILHEVREIRKEIETARRFTPLHAVWRHNLHDPFDQQTPQDLRSTRDEAKKALKVLTDRLNSVKEMDGYDETIYEAQINLLFRCLKEASLELSKITISYEKQKHQQTHIFDSLDVMDMSHQGATADYLIQGTTARQALRATEVRSNDIKEIEGQVEELNDLFNTADGLVLQQEAAIRRVQEEAEETEDNLKGGNYELDGGTKSARNRKTRKWWCLAIIGRSTVSHPMNRLTLAKFLLQSQSL
jgi:hypothetical protein